jgi:hypothetical protein
LFEYFGYVEGWRILPLDDATDSYWRLYNEDHGGLVRFCDSEKLLDDPEEHYYEYDIYTQRHLSKWVYRGKDYTLIVADSGCDQNKFLSIFDNSKERPLAE